MKLTEKIVWGLGGIAFVIGAIGLVQRALTGHALTGYGSHVPWGLWVGLYTVLIGMSAGAFLLATLSLGLGVKRLAGVARPALVIAAATFLGGMLAIWLDLGRPLRAGRLLFATNFTSMMGVLAWVDVAYGLVLVALLWQVAWRGRTETRLVRGLGFVGIFLVVASSGTEGALFGVVGARGFWHSGLTPLKFILDAALSGVALVTLFGVLLDLIDEATVRILRSTVLGLLLAAVLFEFAELSIGYYAAIPAYAASQALVFSGPFWWVFWLVHLVGGVLVPLALLLRERVRAALAIASGLIAATALSTKLNLVIAAQAVPGFQDQRMAYTGPGLGFNYFPTSVEILSALWIVAVVALCALAGYRWLPLHLRRQHARDIA